MTRLVPSVLAASLLAATLATTGAAQQASAPSGGRAAAPAAPAVAAIESQYRPVLRYLLATAEQIPESLYAYRPTANVRTVGELLAHISNFHNQGCAAALGEANPSQEDYEKSRTTKASIIEALRTSAAVCDRAFGQGDAAAMGTTKLFGRDRSRLSVLAMVTGHDWEHYGNLVTYMRMTGITPPSSQ
jgi:uncharacterized damage-inducible protein DinB